MKLIALILTALFVAIPLSACASSTEAESSQPVSEAFAASSLDTDESVEQSSSVPGGRFKAVALGDSITYGYGLKDAEEERWSNVLSTLMKDKYASVEITNEGINGLTGEGLVDLLTNDKPSQLAECDAVLISIGGNNILGFLYEVAGDTLSNVPENLISDYARYAFAAESEDVSQYRYAVAEINKIVNELKAAFESERFKTLVKEAGEKLKTELSQTVALINQANPDADIYVQTVYNPYLGINISLRYIENSVELSRYGDEAVGSLNDAINAGEGYTVVDVYSAFRDSGKVLTNAGINLTTMNIDFDPHPNAEGHRLIAEMYYNTISENTND